MMSSFDEFESVVDRMHDELQKIPILELAEAIPAGARHEDAARQAFLRGINVYREIASKLERRGISVNWLQLDEMRAANRIYFSRITENRSDDDGDDDDEWVSRPSSSRPSSSEIIDPPCPRCRELCRKQPYKSGTKHRADHRRSCVFVDQTRESETASDTFLSTNLP